MFAFWNSFLSPSKMFDMFFFLFSSQEYYFTLATLSFNCAVFPIFLSLLMVSSYYFVSVKKTVQIFLECLKGALNIHTDDILTWTLVMVDMMFDQFVYEVVFIGNQFNHKISLIKERSTMEQPNNVLEGAKIPLHE